MKYTHLKINSEKCDKKLLQRNRKTGKKGAEGQVANNAHTLVTASMTEPSQTSQDFKRMMSNSRQYMGAADKKAIEKKCDDEVRNRGYHTNV